MHESPGLRFARQALRNAKTMEEYTMHARMVEFMRREDLDPVQARMMDDVDVPSTPPPMPVAPKCATTATTKGAKCMGTKKGDRKPCDKNAEDGFLTCGYHRAQEEELRKNTVPRVDSNASTATNAQAPPPTQPSVAQLTRKGSRLKPPSATKKRKRGDDEEELEHTDHSPDEIVPDCPACAAGCGELTQPTISPILHSEQADQRDYRFDSPEPEDRVERGLPLPPCPTLLPGPAAFNVSLEPPRQRRRILPGSYIGRSAGKNPVHPTDSPEDRVILPSPTSTDEAEQTGFRTQDEVMRALTTTAFFTDPGHYISDTRARATRACEAEAKRKAEEEAKRKADEESRRKAEEYIKSLDAGTFVDLASIMESFRKGEDNRLEELCKELRESVIPKTIEDFIKDNNFTLPVSVVKDRFEEYKITCQEPYSGDMSGARKKIKDRCNRIQVTANVKRAMKFHKDRFRL